jgi:Tol biopolymer transport system component
MMASAGGGSSATISVPAQNLFEASFDPSGRRLVFVRSATSSPALDASPSGQIVTSNLSGGDTRVLTGTGTSEPAISPNGRAVLFVRAGAIWIVRANGTNPRRLITDAAMPDWSPNGRSIVFVAGNYAHGKHVLSLTRSDGSHRQRLLGAYPGRRSGPLTYVDYAVFSPDGKQIAFSTSAYDGSGDPYVFRLPAAGGGVRMLWTTGLLDAGGTDLGVAWQPLR